MEEGVRGVDRGKGAKVQEGYGQAVEGSVEEAGAAMRENAVGADDAGQLEAYLKESIDQALVEVVKELGSDR